MNFELGTMIAIATLIIVILGHLCTTVWWMSKITTTLATIGDNLKEAMTDIKALVPKQDCTRIHDHLDKSLDDVWDAIKELRNK